ncbi:Transcriptional activator hac1 [Colletotrichum sp. SAR 10_70]|nr:Transcriptional activator hac1 [Colletotrichum sp. SAR 10_71]KAI8156718.1 Transcriptional activator hac1 [Colletotrichum sp. SAR 10_70]KAI8173131.1 Transcriptional activator hac1 [Colletotrichum sp. SAR 10_75]KAJ4995427.1 Transcriptional activator hac1 [Colletotrichum sp. SAR 10_66]
MIKFEDSPAESFVSTPGELYPSLFGDAAPLAADDTTVNPSDMLTPPPFTEDNPVSTPDTDSPSTEKKPVKKRKSWGQVLPEPKTNLPPRKRAKTEDEKEQRRVERVLRNRRAAQSSRERKRLEVEALERRNKELEAALSNVTKANQLLVEELNKFRRDSGMLTRSSSPLDPLRSNTVTLSPELFGSHDGHRPSIDETKNLVDDLMTTSRSNPTVNPASLSPELSPIAEDDEAGAEDNEVAETNVKSSSDLTQPSDAVNHIIGDSFSLSAALDTDRYVLESGLLSSPNSLDYEHDYLAGDSTAFLQDPFDISEFLNDEVNGSVSDTNAVIGTAVAADPDYGRDSTNSETQVSSENPNLQPHSGASTYGCDDGGIAVGI